MAAKSNTNDREIISIRIVNAPRDLVWTAWTDPKHLIHWWGPRGFTNTFQECNPVVGGNWDFIMRAPNGTEFKNKISYVELKKPERIVLRHETAPLFDIIATFEDQGAKTKITFHQIFDTVEAYEQVKHFAVPGNEQNFDRIEEELARMQQGLNKEFVVVRSLDAPRDLVWAAWTEPKHLNQWWGPQGFTMNTVKMDFKPGGVFLYSMTAPAGSPMSGEMWGKFVYQEIQKPEKVIFTNSFSDQDGGTTRHPMSNTWPLEVRNVLTFSEQGTRTIVMLRGTPHNATDEERKTFESGFSSMQQGFSGTFTQLETYLNKAKGQ